MDKVRCREISPRGIARGGTLAERWFNEKLDDVMGYWAQV